jgi:hypothetical protein
MSPRCGIEMSLEFYGLLRKDAVADNLYVAAIGFRSRRYLYHTFLAGEQSAQRGG